MSQFFSSNPAARPPQGPRRGPWRRGLPRTWKEAFADPSDAPDDERATPASRAEGETADGPSGRPR